MAPHFSSHSALGRKTGWDLDHGKIPQAFPKKQLLQLGNQFNQKQLDGITKGLRGPQEKAKKLINKSDEIHKVLAF